MRRSACACCPERSDPPCVNAVIARMSGGRVRIHAATVNPTDVGVRIGSLGLLSNFKRRTSRIFRIDNISVGMDPSLLNEGAIGRGDYRRTRLQRPSTGCSRGKLRRLQRPLLGYYTDDGKLIYAGQTRA